MKIYIKFILIMLFIILVVFGFKNLNGINNKSLEGYLIYGHEVREFQPCGLSEGLWILGDSPAMESIKTNYNKLTKGRKPYTQIFAILEGEFMDSPEDGFGADYTKSFFAKKLIELSPIESCKRKLIILEEPLTGSGIKSPLEIRGVARGSWYFEGDFPIILTDWDGKIIAESFATAQTNWMTEEFVPFKGILEFEKPDFGERGSLILKKDNPSGLPENDDALEITVYFE